MIFRQNNFPFQTHGNNHSGSSDGLVGRKIREHGLGLDVPPRDWPRAIEVAVANPHTFDESARQAFVAASSPEQFTAALLEI